MTSSAMDRWSSRPVLGSVAIVSGISVLSGWPGVVSFFLIPLSVLFYATAAVCLSATAFIFAARKRPRAASSLSCALIAPVLLWLPIHWAKNCAHLALTVEVGLGQLGWTVGPQTGEFAVSDWSVGLAGGTNRFLIRDETDEIGKPLPRGEGDTQKQRGFTEACAGRTRHLIAHYYVCEF